MIEIRQMDVCVSGTFKNCVWPSTQSFPRTSVRVGWERMEMPWFFTSLHATQTRSSDENSVRLSVRHTRAL